MMGKGSFNVFAVVCAASIALLDCDSSRLSSSGELVNEQNDGEGLTNTSSDGSNALLGGQDDTVAAKQIVADVNDSIAASLPSPDENSESLDFNAINNCPRHFDETINQLLNSFLVRYREMRAGLEVAIDNGLGSHLPKLTVFDNTIKYLIDNPRSLLVRCIPSNDIASTDGPVLGAYVFETSLNLLADGTYIYPRFTGIAFTPDFFREDGVSFNEGLARLSRIYTNVDHNLARSCIMMGNVAHELMHVMGVSHAGNNSPLGTDGIYQYGHLIESTCYAGRWF